MLLSLCLQSLWAPVAWRQCDAWRQCTASHRLRQSALSLLQPTLVRLTIALKRTAVRFTLQCLAIVVDSQKPVQLLHPAEDGHCCYL